MKKPPHKSIFWGFSCVLIGAAAGYWQHSYCFSIAVAAFCNLLCWLVFYLKGDVK